MDKAGDQDMDVIKLRYASAGEMVRLVTNLEQDGSNQGATPPAALPRWWPTRRPTPW